MKPKPEVLVTVDVPGAFDRFLEGTSEVQGDNGNTPFRLAYRAADRIVRGRGYSLRLRFPAADADAILGVLRTYAETCVDCNSGQMDEQGVRTEVAGAHTVLARCDKLTAELKARSADNAADATDTEPEAAPAPGGEPVPVAAKWYPEPHADGFRVTNGTDYLTDPHGQQHVYDTSESAEWFANAATARDRDRQLRPRHWLTVLDGKEIRWLSTSAIKHGRASVTKEWRAVVSIVDPEAGHRARLIEPDADENGDRKTHLSGKPLGYTKFGQYTHLSFARFALKYPEYAYLVQGINEGRGVTRQVRLNADGNDMEGLWR